MAELAEADVARLSGYLASRSDVSFAFLFGSAVSGRLTEESDVDIAVYIGQAGAASGAYHPQLEETAEVPELDEVWARLERITGREVDLVLLNSAPAAVCAQAITTGRKLVMQDRGLYLRYLAAVTDLAEEFRGFQRDYIAIRRRSSSLTESDRARLERIAAFLEAELEDAPQYTGVSKDRYLTDRNLRRAMERWVENLVNASIDVAKMVLASEGLPPPQTYRETLGNLAAIPGFADIAAELATNARLRNAGAHAYLDMRFSEVSRVAEQATSLYGALAAATGSFLSR